MSRGIRNNNPFNIIRSNINWMGKLKGLLTLESESKFEQFETLEQGVRAGLLNLRNGYKNKGFNTPKKIINRYAPSFDNSVASQTNYAKAVAVGVFGNAYQIETVIMSNDQWLKAAHAMQKFENGTDSLTLEQLKKINQDEKIFI